MTEKVKRLLARDELSEGDLPDVPEEEPSDKAPYWEYMIHTPDEGEKRQADRQANTQKNTDIYCSTHTDHSDNDTYRL